MSKGKVTEAEYAAKLQKELQRSGASRDEAVRATNVYFDLGNSTENKFGVPEEIIPTAEPKG
jgi:hypothetical protein